MKKKVKLKKFNGSHQGKVRVPEISDRRIIPIDDGPLREKATRDYQRAMAKLDKSCADQRRFEQKDKPEFDQWMAVKFGPLLTDLRANERLIQQQEDLIDAVEEEMFWSHHHNPKRAYAEVMKARETPAAEKWDEDPFHQPNDKKNKGGTAEGFNPYQDYDPNASETEIKKHFADFLKEAFGLHPSDLSKADYQQGFAQFKAQFFHQKTAPISDPKTKKPGAKEGLLRIKEIYRILVRRLHPDLKAKRDLKVSTLWHEVQEAYKTRNLERLETILALTEMQEGKNATIRLSQMRGALDEVNRTLRAIQSSLALSKKDPAWGFSLSPNHDPLEKRLRRQMETELASQKWVLADLKKILESWTRVPETKKKSKKSGSTKKKESSKTTKAELPKKSSTHSIPVQSEFFTF